MTLRSTLTVALAGLLYAGSGYGQTLLIDRGLPVNNLNISAGANRSNWGFTFGTEPDPSGVYNYMVVDSFDLGDPCGGGPVQIDTIRLWVTPSSEVTPAVYQLLLSSGGSSTLTVASTVTTGTTVTYANGESYQTDSGFIPILQLDFPVNRNFAPNTRIYFAISGVDAGGAFAPPYVHAANAARGGGAQQSADDRLYWYFSADRATWLVGAQFDSSAMGLSLSTDMSVQVFGRSYWGANAGLKLGLQLVSPTATLRIEGAQIGEIIAIETSTDLITWTLAETRTVSQAVENYTFPYSGVGPREFFRVKRTYIGI